MGEVVPKEGALHGGEAPREGSHELGLLLPESPLGQASQGRCVRLAVNQRGQVIFNWGESPKYAPLVTQLGHDPRPVVILCSTNEDVVAIGADGHGLWRVTPEGFEVQAPVAADLDGDDGCEIVLARSYPSPVAVLDSAGNVVRATDRLSTDGVEFFDRAPAAATLPNGRTVVAWQGGQGAGSEQAAATAGHQQHAPQPPKQPAAASM